MKIFLKTPQGTIRVSGSEAGISEIKFLDEEQQTTSDIPDFLLPAIQQLQAYFKGDLKEFHLKLDLQGTDFQKKVWNAILEIPYGKTLSYLELSRKLGDVNAIRAVASANGKNPVWIVVPCHRVIGSDGSLTGYAGGLERKRYLLHHEGALVQQSLF